MTIDEAMKYFNSAYDLCKKINSHGSNFTRWKKTGFIPVTQQLKINMVIGENLPIDLSKEDMRKRVQGEQ